MAYYGLRYPVIAKNTNGTFSDGFVCGKAVSVTVTPNYVEGSLYGDDVQAEYEKSFQNAAVSLGVTELPNEAATVMFGHTVDSTSKAVTFKGTDEPNYVGLGYVVPQSISGKKTFVAQILKKVKFSEPSDSFTTKGDSITFGTPSLSGTAIVDESGEWKKTKEFDTADAALAFVKTELGIASK